MSGQVTSMLEEWEGAAPDWVIRLAEECAATSQSNMLRVRMFRACNHCPRNMKERPDV